MRVWSLTKRLMKQIARDRRTMALFFVAPLLVLWLMSIVLNINTTKSTIDTVNAPSALTAALATEGATVHAVSLDTAKSDVNAGTVDAYITLTNGVHIVLEGSDPTRNSAVMQTVRNALSRTSGATDSLPVTYIHGGGSLTKLDYFAPVLIGFFIFFFVFLISGVSFLRERTSGTLERMLATPLRRYEVVMGYFFGFGVFALLQTTVLQLFVLYVLKVHSAGSFWSVLVVNVLLATVALALGSWLSAFARNEFQMVQFIPIVVVPQAFLSGLFDLRNFPQWLHVLSNILPLTFAANALRGVMIRGQNLTDLPIPMLALAGYCILFLVFNVLALKRYRAN